MKTDRRSGAHQIQKEIHTFELYYAESYEHILQIAEYTDSTLLIRKAESTLHGDTNKVVDRETGPRKIDGRISIAILSPESCFLVGEWSF